MHRPRNALTAAINRAIAEGAPVYANRNSFQHWAIQYASEHGCTAVEIGDWVTLRKGTAETDCMSREGVKSFCARHRA